MTKLLLLQQQYYLLEESRYGNAIVTNGLLAIVAPFASQKVKSWNVPSSISVEAGHVGSAGCSTNGS